MHPRNRAERRHIREVWRNHRRKLIVQFYSYQHQPHIAELNKGWMAGGKQYFACGNRCSLAMWTRYQNHAEVRALRRAPIELEDLEDIQPADEAPSSSTTL